MKLNKTLMILGATILASTMLSSCGDQPTTSTPNGGNVDALYDISAIQDDLVIEDGEAVFDEEVEINLWSIITQPDNAYFQKVVKEFNNQHMGEIKIVLKEIGHYDYYTTLRNTWTNERESFPDVMVMHNEKTIEFANEGYLYALDDLIGEKTTVDFDFTQAYSNIDRVTKYNNHRFAIPLDAHGFLTSIRQDIIKKNNLGFENNTRFIPQSRAEYQSLLENARKLADEGKLLVRNCNRIDWANSNGTDHSWHYVNAENFSPSYMQSSDPDGLSALYANGGTLTNEDQTTITYHQNTGFQAYITDQVDRYNNRLMWDGNTATGGNTEMFASGNTLMFSEGPWWVGQTYTAEYNSDEMGKTEVTVGGKTYKTGITAEDAADPIYSKPLVATHPQGWWTLEENSNLETANKWYGNGHAISISKTVTSLTKVTAILKFAHWLTQEKSEADENTYNLTNWCVSGHLPAWKNVYDSDTYQAVASKSAVLTGLGDPADIIALEGLVNETLIFNSIATSITTVQGKLTSGTGCDKSQAITLLNETAQAIQDTLDFMSM